MQLMSSVKSISKDIAPALSYYKLPPAMPLSTPEYGMRTLYAVCAIKYRKKAFYVF